MAIRVTDDFTMMTFVAIYFGVFLMQQTSDSFTHAYCVVPWQDLSASGEFYRLLTGPFLHDDWEHLAANICGLVAMGRLNAPFGTGKVVIMYLMCGLCAALGSSVLTGRSVGASGAIFGCTGMLVAHLRRHADTLTEEGREMWKRIGIVRFGGLVIWFVENIAKAGGAGHGCADASDEDDASDTEKMIQDLIGRQFGFKSESRTDHFAHTVGFLAGFLLAWVMGPNIEIKYFGMVAVDRPLCSSRSSLARRDPYVES
eukprot:426437-Rhodomonas_salina.1